MVKLIAASSPILVALTLAAVAVHGQSPAPPQPVTAVGCIVRNGAVDLDKGTRQLNTEPNGLALTSARITATKDARASAVPGSIPEGSNSGTIPNQTIVGGKPQQAETLAFALTGEPAKGLGDYVGRRVEIVGRLANPVTSGAEQARGTSGSARGAAPVPGDGTREERPAEGTAHPSAELRKLEVVSFRAVTGGCE